MIFDRFQEEIVPVRPARVVAFARENGVAPKSLSGRIWQSPSHVQPDGASTTHSAESIPGCFIFSFLRKVPPVVWLRSRIVTFLRRTVTLALITSPPLIRIRIGRDGAGISSYHAAWRTRPLRVQIRSVPVCSR